MVYEHDSFLGSVLGFPLLWKLPCCECPECMEFRGLALVLSAGGGRAQSLWPSGPGAD